MKPLSNMLTGIINQVQIGSNSLGIDGETEKDGEVRKARGHKSWKERGDGVIPDRYPTFTAVYGAV